MDDDILHEIEALQEQERALRASGSADPQTAERIKALEVRLDQCWDLLRQKRALREFGGDESEAKIRPASVVERFEN